MLIHRDDCPGPVIDHFLGDRGDTMEKCRRCRALGVADPATAPAVSRPARQALLVPPCSTFPRYGDKWPTHRGKRRHGPKVAR